MLYVNGITVAVIELKRFTIPVGEGIRKNIRNQEQHFIKPFCTTVQVVIGGNESQGHRHSRAALAPMAGS